MAQLPRFEGSLMFGTQMFSRRDLQRMVFAERLVACAGITKGNFPIAERRRFASALAELRLRMSHAANDRDGSVGHFETFAHSAEEPYLRGKFRRCWSCCMLAIGALGARNARAEAPIVDAVLRLFAALATPGRGGNC